MTPLEKTVLSLNWALTIGGVARYNVLLKGVSTCKPIRMRYLCILSDAWHTDDASLGELDPLTIKIRSRLDFSWLPQVARAIRDISPDLILTHGFNAHFVMWMMRRFFSIDTPVAISYHGSYYPPTWSRKFIAPLFNGFTYYFARRHACSVASVSEYSKRELTEKGIPLSKISVIHNGIADLEPPNAEESKLRHEFGFTDQHLVLGVTARIDHIKGLDILLEAFGHLAAQDDRLRLVIVGTGPLESSLKQRATELGVSHKVVWTGFRTDIRACLATFDIFVLPSLAENHSIALLEAMRAGNAIVATNVGGNTESVRDGKDALVVAPGDADAIIDAVTRLAASCELRARLAKSARARFIKHFRQSTMVEKAADWLMSLIDDSEAGHTHTNALKASTSASASHR